MKKAIFIGAILLIMIGCEGKSNVIAKIPEASGICFSQNSKTLFVADDEGKVFEIDKEGKILRKRRLGKYDLEGVACDDSKGELLFAIEGKDNILVVGQKNLKIRNNINIKRSYHGQTILKKDRENKGLEGIAIVGNTILLSNQSNQFLPNKNPSLLIKVDKSSKKKVTILKLFEHGHKDISGLSYHDNYLYMVSDKEDLLLKYSLDEERVLFTVKLPIFAQEGVAFDDEGYIYFADDDGGVFKYTKEKFGL